MPIKILTTNAVRWRKTVVEAKVLISFEGGKRSLKWLPTGSTSPPKKRREDRWRVSLMAFPPVTWNIKPVTEYKMRKTQMFPFLRLVDLERQWPKKGLVLRKAIKDAWGKMLWFKREEAVDREAALATNLASEVNGDESKTNYKYRINRVSKFLIGWCERQSSTEAAKGHSITKASLANKNDPT